MSENVRKLVGVVVMAVLVVVGVVVSSGDDTDFTRNTAFTKGGVITKDAGAEKGGDCCDETLYRLGQIEDRLSQIETSLQQALPLVRDARPVENGPTADQILATLEAWIGQDPMRLNVAALATSIPASGVLLGVPLRTAQEAVNRLGVGFVHSNEDGRDLDTVPYWGTRRDLDGFAVMMILSTRNGLVSEVIGQGHQF